MTIDTSRDIDRDIDRGNIDSDEIDAGPLAPAVRPDRLLRKARITGDRPPDGRQDRSTNSRLVDAGCRRTLRALLGRMRHEHLVLDDVVASTIATYGAAQGTDDGLLVGHLTVHDTRAYRAVLLEGAAGFGRGYIEGWWTSDDPLVVLQIVIRNLRGVDRLRNRLHRSTGWLTDRIRARLPHDSRARNLDDIGAHYDIGNEFFELFLDETMTYSSAVFPTLDTSLADASRHKYDVLLDKLGATAGQRLLEIGTGWGGLALRAADRGCDVTTTTISREQAREAAGRFLEAGLDDRITLLDDDWRDLRGRFDRLVSIEMIEAVDWRDYDDFFATIERSLEYDGAAALQAICIPDERWGRAKNTIDFIRRFVFPNGYLPSVAAIEAAALRATDLRVVDVEDLTPHYAETLRRWRSTFESRLDEVRSLGLDERFIRLWRFYLVYCEAGFLERHCTVNHVVLARPGFTGPVARDRSPFPTS